ncbi:MAG: elongation factor P maturation arginine rhamnosyltransferase EarP [Spirochaetales bacterium]|nr:elongation factor P maturation arginine rhamnosyltransferase EarP [Spirochaetales bacterium]
MLIDVFCRIIDNLGDAAVVGRLARGLVLCDGSLRVRLFFSGVETFTALVPETLPQIRFWDVEKSRNDPDAAPGDADVLIEAFGESPPDWYQEAFRGGRLSALKCRLVLHLEYLTAEAWAQEYHLLPSPTGVPGVEKYFFVPGFSERTGGVFLDPEFLKLKSQRMLLRRALEQRWTPGVAEKSLWLLVFSYEHDYSSFWKDLADWSLSNDQTAVVFSASGRSAEGVRSSFQSIAAHPGTKNIRLQELPFLPQTAFDALLLACDFLIVRGEDSWVRAVLSGKPFLWHAYLQADAHQRVKVDAFLAVAKPFFKGKEDLFEAWSREFRSLNDRRYDSWTEPARERYGILLERRVELEAVLEQFADWVENHLNLERSLLEFIGRFRL